MKAGDKENKKQWWWFPEKMAMTGGIFMGSESRKFAQFVWEFFLLEGDLFTSVWSAFSESQFSTNLPILNHQTKGVFQE